MKRIYNFNAGPAMLPLEVLQEVQSELLDLQGCNQELKTELDHATDQINRSEVKFVVMVIFRM